MLSGITRWDYDTIRCFLFFHIEVQIKLGKLKARQEICTLTHKRARADKSKSSALTALNKATADVVAAEAEAAAIKLLVSEVAVPVAVPIAPTPAEDASAAGAETATTPATATPPTPPTAVVEVDDAAAASEPPAKRPRNWFFW